MEIIIIIIILIIAMNVLESIPANLEAFLAFPFLSRSFYVAPSLGIGELILVADYVISMYTDRASTM
jgi:hypothetical protein